MLLNYLKLSLRLLARNPFFTFINVAGLSVGFAVFFILWQYSQSELKSDQQWKDWERIVRFGYIWKWTDDGKQWSQSQFGEGWPEIAKQVSEDFEEIEDLTRIFRQENFTPEHIPLHGKDIFLTHLNERGEPISFKENALVYADPNLFRFFSIPLLAGNPDKALTEINSIVLCRKLATRYFGNKNPINQTLLINNHIQLKVTGVYDDLPSNSHLEFEAVLSTVTIDRYISVNQFALGGSHTYFRLNPEVTAETLEKKINGEDNYWRYWGPKIREDSLIRRAELYLQPLKDVPFTNFRWDYFKPKSRYLLNALGWVGLLTLGVAWINFIQLSASFYGKRMKEIGIRKTTGAKSWDFVKQFMTESMLINFLSLSLAATLIQMAKMVLKLVFGFYVLPWHEVPGSTLIIVSLACMSGILLSGLLPMIFFRTLSPRSLFHKQISRAGNITFIKPLVAVQFCFSIVLMVWVFTVHNQVDFVLKANYGLNREAVALLDLPQVRTESFYSDLSYLTKKIKSKAGVEDATYLTSITGDAENNMICLKRIDNENHSCVDTNGGVTENFIPFFNIELLAGRNFRAAFPSDSATVILSRKAALRLGFANAKDAIGRKILVNTGSFTNWNFQESEVIGVVEDYMGGNVSLLINEGMGNGHAGIILTYKDRLIASSKAQKMAIRIDAGSFADISKEVQKIYAEVFPGQLFHFYFLDDQVARFYDGEKTARNQILLFTLIAIGISCLGLLGMISNKVAEKTKEIGIRKVLGAQLHQIAQILLNTTVKQIVMATVIGIPTAYYLTQQYLQKFSQRIELQWWHFALPVLILVVIMFSTVISVLWKAAKSNPVEALKYE